MTTQPPPPGAGQPEDDPYLKQPPAGSGGGSPYDAPQPPQGNGGSPYDPPPASGGNGGGYGATPPPPPPSGGDSGGFGAAPPPPPPGAGGAGGYGAPPPGGGNPYGGDPYGGGYGGSDPLAGMPPLADIGKRLLARFLDILVIVIPISLLSTLTGSIKVTADKGEDFGDVVADANSGGQWLWKIIALAAYVLYDWLMVRKNGQTLGKKWLGLRVANLSDGSTPDSSAALTRAAVLQIPAVLCCCVWWLILIVLIASDKPYRQGLHDKAAKTVVVTV